MRKVSNILFLAAGIICLSSLSLPKDKPTIYIIGDSTVKNGKGVGDGGMWGWGDLIGSYFDTTKIRIENDAIGGRSSRTFQTEGRWDAVVQKLKPGDFVFMQFGHNDGGPYNTGRARASIKGTGNDTLHVIIESTGKPEIVYSYGWYMRKYIKDTRAKGAIPVVCTPVPRNKWVNGRVVRDSSQYAKWAIQVAREENVTVVDLNSIIADYYNKLDEANVKATYFTAADNTHTSLEGAKLNAACVIKGLKKSNKYLLKKYLSPLGKKAGKR